MTSTKAVHTYYTPAELTTIIPNALTSTYPGSYARSLQCKYSVPTLYKYFAISFLRCLFSFQAEGSLDIYSPSGIGDYDFQSRSL